MTITNNNTLVTVSLTREQWRLIADAAARGLEDQQNWLNEYSDEETDIKAEQAEIGQTTELLRQLISAAGIAAANSNA